MKATPEYNLAIVSFLIKKEVAEDISSGGRIRIPPSPPFFCRSKCLRVLQGWLLREYPGEVNAKDNLLTY